MLRSLAPSVERLLLMFFKGFPVAVVDIHKVLHDVLIIQLASSSQDPAESYMLHIVAQVAQSDEASKFLNVPVIVIVPYLMTVELSFRITDSYRLRSDVRIQCRSFSESYPNPV